MDDIILPIWIEFFTIRITDAEDISREFDRHDLGTETDPEIGDFIHTGVLCRHDHPFGPAIPESTRDTDPIEVFEEFRSFFFDVFRLDESEFYAFLMGKSCSLESFIE